MSLQSMMNFINSFKFSIQKRQKLIANRKTRENILKKTPCKYNNQMNKKEQQVLNNFVCVLLFHFALRLIHYFVHFISSILSLKLSV